MLAAIVAAGVAASVLLADVVPVGYRLYLAEFAGLVAIALGVLQANSESKPDATNDRPA